MGSPGSLNASRYPLPLLHLRILWVSAFEAWSAQWGQSFAPLRPAEANMALHISGSSLIQGGSPPYPARLKSNVYIWTTPYYITGNEAARCWLCWAPWAPRAPWVRVTPMLALTQELVMQNRTGRSLFGGTADVPFPESKCGVVWGIFSSFPALSPTPSSSP